MSPLERDRQFRIRLSDDELAMLHELAERDGVSAADFLRLYIRRSHAEAFQGRRPKKQK